MPKGQRTWTQEHLNVVQAGLRARKTAQAIAKELGRTQSSVTNLISIYRLRPESPDVLLRDVRRLRDLPAGGGTLPGGADDLPSTRRTDSVGKVLRPWSESDITKVKAMIVEGLSYEEIAGRTGRTVHSVKGMVKSRGLTRNVIVEEVTGRPARLINQPHPEEVNRAILKAYVANEVVDIIAVRFGVSGGYVNRLARKAGLSKRPKGPGTPWTPEKVARLIELKSMTPPTSAARCAEILEVSKAAVDIRSSRMRLLVMSRPKVVQGSRSCRRCGEEKPLTEFPFTGRKRPGHTCRSCGNMVVQVRLYGAVRPLGATCHLCGTDERIHLDHDHVTGKARGLLCRAHNTGVGLAGESAERLRVLALYCETSRSGRFMPAVPVSTVGAGLTDKQEVHRLWKYGLTPSDVRELLARQGGVCRGCSGAFGKGNTLEVDHDHRSGEIRGLLCGGCNSALGQFDDDVEMLRKAAGYLDNPPGIHVEVPVADRTPVDELCGRFGMEPVSLPGGLLGARRDKTIVVVIDGAQHNRRLLLTRDGIPTHESTSWLARWQASQQATDPELDVLLIRRDQLGHHLDSLLVPRFTEVEKLNARDLVVRDVPIAEAKAFVEARHLQGGCRSPLNLGLYTEGGALVSVMSFSTATASVRNAHKKGFRGWYLQRFCSRGRVRGGASKLLAAFRARFPTDIVTHSDPAYSDGGLYATLGFRKATESTPDYIYWKDMVFYPKGNCQKKDLVEELERAGRPCDHTATETTLAALAGYDRIDLPGKIRWELDAPV